MSRSLTRLQAIVLGAVVVVGLALAGTGLFAVGSRQLLWSDVFHVRVGFSQVRGVEAGTRVRVQGIDAGEVEAVQPPPTPGDKVVLRLRLDGKLRHLIRADASAQIVSEGMVGGRVVEIHPGSADAGPITDDALIASRPTAEVADLVGHVGAVLQEVRGGKGTVGKLMKDEQAYEELVQLLQQTNETMNSFQQNADAIKRLPLMRNYVEDPRALLVRPNCERHRRWFAEDELFEPGQATLTRAGRQRLNDLAPWANGLKHAGSEVVVVAYADPKSSQPNNARILTRKQSEAVTHYLTENHGIHKMGWFSSRKVTPLGMGVHAPPEPDKDFKHAAGVEVLVFVPRD